jgi:hypothetical protein
MPRSVVDVAPFAIRHCHHGFTPRMDRARFLAYRAWPVTRSTLDADGQGGYRMIESRVAMLLSGALTLSLGAVGCISTHASPPDDITGDWHGSYQDKAGNTGSIDATFTQSGSTLGGSMTLSWACAIANNASVNGTITGDSFTAKMVYGFTTVSIAATRSGTSVTGSFTISGGICNGRTGTLTLGR